MLVQVDVNDALALKEKPISCGSHFADMGHEEGRGVQNYAALCTETDECVC